MNVSYENCQVGVFLSYITEKGHSLIDRELYLPLDWCEDADRRSAVHIPEGVRFQTKPALAAQMMARLERAAVPIDWVVADTVYGGNFDLRSWLEAHQYHYVLAVACTEPISFQTSEGRMHIEAALVETFFPLLQWHRLSMSEGTKGPRFFDWALIPLLHHWEDDGCHFLLIRRSIIDPSEKRYYVVFAPPHTSLPVIVAAIGCRWRIEEDFEQAKDMGLDHYEVRCFMGWYRHVTLVMLAAAYLAGIVVGEQCQACSAILPPAPSYAFPLLPITTPEVRHLLGRLIWPSPRNVKRALHWSRWRRTHQSCASYFHVKRRREAG